MARGTLRSWIGWCVVIAGSAVPAFAVESYTRLASGQRIVGDVTAGSDIRLEFPVAAGSEPRLTFVLTGAKPNQPISFISTQLFGPDGQEIDISGATSVVRHTTGRDSISFTGYTATQSGNHQLLIRTNARIKTKAHGKLTIVRSTRIPFVGDQTSAPLEVPLQPGDRTSVVVRGTSGSAPKVIRYEVPSGSGFTPSQAMTKKGSESRWLYAVEFGVHKYTIGYQADPQEGAWKGFVKIRPFRGRSSAYLTFRNSPGIPLTIFDADRLLTLTGPHVGVATDDVTLLVTTDAAGAVSAQRYGLDLATLPGVPAVSLTFAGDLSLGQTLGGHRLMRMGSFYYLAFGSASGQELALARIRTVDLLRDGFAQLATSATDSTADFFLVGDGTKVSVGQPIANAGHTVYLAPATDFGLRTTVTIGGGAYPQSAGSGAAWRPGDTVFEFWTPDNLTSTGPSDLHRVLYDRSWAPVTADARVVNDPQIAETMPTAVVVDGPTQATILFYVVPDNPPADAGFPGSGTIHRRIFDATGVEVPDAHAVLPVHPANRPSAVVVGKFLYLGYETPSGPRVERQPILR